MFCLVLTIGCATSDNIPKLDIRSGHFPTNEKAKTIFELPLDLSNRKDILLVPGFSDDPHYLVRLVSQKKFFDEVLILDDLEKKAIADKPLESFDSVHDRFGMHSLATKYRQFLWLEVEYSREGNYGIIDATLTDPVDMKSYFKTEVRFDQYWNGLNSRNAWYPLINSFIDYVEKNR